MIKATKEFLLALQEKICQSLERLDGTGKFSTTQFDSKDSAGFSNPRVLVGDGHIEKAAVNFTYSVGSSLPSSVSDSKREIAGLPFEAVSLSLIVHPSNPFIPTTHMNLRLFVVEKKNLEWHFGGGYDLTPIYGFIDDARTWHLAAKTAAREHYYEMKEKCDNYFYLPHRKEHRGIGGLFFDDLNQGQFDSAFRKVERIGNSFLPVYEEIFERRKSEPYSTRNREFQLYRRGRYAEFNLLIDRGTRYGLESGKRVENVLASMPPMASWVFNFPIEEGSEEYRLTDYFLKPRDWTQELEN